MTTFLSDIILSNENDIQFKNSAGNNAGKISQTGNDLVLSNDQGDIFIGDGASDVYIGDGINTVDILFEKSGSIAADPNSSNVTLTIGSSNTSVVFAGDIDFGSSLVQTNATTNLATSKGWVVDPAPLSETQVGEFGGNFNRNGDASENAVVYGIDPFGNKGLLWKAVGGTADHDDDGGWNKDITIAANDNMGYLSYVYFKIDFTPNENGDGQFYHGAGMTSGQTLNLDGTSNTNPYFNSGRLDTLFFGSQPVVANRWYVSVGILQAYNNTTTDTDTVSGIYDVETGEKLKNGAEYKMGQGATGQRHRTYLYYQGNDGGSTATTGNGNVFFWGPGFHAIDGSEPKIQDLVKLRVSRDIRINNGELFLASEQTTVTRKPVRIFRDLFKGGITLQRDGVDNVNISSSAAEIGHTYFNGNGVNVGIGTTTPSNKLDVQDTSATYVARFRGASATYVQSGENTLSGETGFLAKNSTGALFMAVDSGVAFLTGTSGANTMTFGVGGSEKMRLTSTGQLGIGTTTPSTKLDVVGGDIKTDSNVIIPSDGFLKTSNNNLNFIELYNGSDASMRFRMGHSTVGRFQFLNSSDTEVFTIDARNEKIGIGTTSPSKTLSVNGTLQSTGEAFFNNFDITNTSSTSRFRSGHIVHFNTNRTINLHTSSEDFYITNSETGKDILLQCDDGDGGTSTYIRLDGSAQTVEIQAVTNFASNVSVAGNLVLGSHTVSTDNAKVAFNSRVSGSTPTGTNDFTTKSYVDLQISNLVDSAPDTLNTLNELADALGDDANFSTTVTNSIAGKVAKSGDTMTGTLTAPRVQAEGSTFPQMFVQDTSSGGGSSKTMQIGMSGTSMFIKKSDDTGTIFFRNSNNTDLLSIGMSDTGQVTVANELQAGSLDVNGIANISGQLMLEGTTDQALILKATDDGPIYHSYFRGTDRHAFIGFGGSSDVFSIVNEESAGFINLSTAGTTALSINSSQNATFAGDITVTGGQVFLTDTNYAIENVGGNYGVRNVSGDYGGSDGTSAYTTPQDFFHIPGTVRIGPKYATSDRDYIRLIPSGTTSTIEMPNENAYIHNNSGNIVLRTGANTDAVTVTGSNTTFAGNATATNFIATTGVYSNLGIYYGSTILEFKNDTGTKFLDFTSSLNANFAGDVTVNGGDIYLALSGSTQRAVASTGTNSLQVGDAGVQMIRFKNASGNFLDIAADGNATFAKGVVVNGGALQVNNAAADKKLSFDRTGGKGISVEHDASSIYFYNETDAAPMFKMFNGGDVRAYGEVEATSLDINGNADISGTLTVTNSSTFNDPVTITGPASASGSGVLDIRDDSGDTSLRFGGNSTYSWIQSHSNKPLRINEAGNAVVLGSGDLTLNGSTTINNAVTINKNGDALNLRSTTNAQPTRITFSSDVPDVQIGHIEYTHSNTASYGGGEAFIIGGTETITVILADGQLMYKNGIYSKPSSGTGAGTRKDTNWDTAYTYSQVDHLPLAGGTMTGQLTLAEDPTNDLHAATKQYVDEAVTSAGGGSSFTDINVAGNIIHTGDTDTKITFGTNTITLGTAGNAQLELYSDDVGVKDNLQMTSASAQIQFIASAGGANEGITYKDTGGSFRYGMLFPGSNKVAITNRAANGKVEIRANSSTAGASGESVAAEFASDKITFNKPIQLVAGTTPSDPPAGHAVIYLDGNGDIKAKITGEEETVTRTLATFEG